MPLNSGMLSNPTAIWLLIGVALCLIELVVPTAFVAAVMGISALVVAMVSSVLPFGLQVVVWMGLSLALVMGSRRFVRRSPATHKFDATEAETLTEIAPSKPGRVLYEGNSWAAQCDDAHMTIAPHQRVIVVSRRGTTLVVVPENALHS